MHAHSPNNPRAPLVLACGSTALRFLSGRLTKLAALTNLSGTNLDAEGARRVSGMDATNQTGKSLILTKSRYSSTQKGMFGAHLNSWVHSSTFGIVGFRKLNPTYPGYKLAPFQFINQFKT